VCNLLIREIQAHEIQTQYPDFQRLMMSRKNRVRQVIKVPITVMTLITLTGGFRVIKAALDDLLGFTRWTCNTVWPAQLANGLITLNLIDQILDVDLHHWTPVRDWNMGGHQCTPSSNATTLESNMSVNGLQAALERGLLGNLWIFSDAEGDKSV
jgi:hypothetical protein